MEKKKTTNAQLQRKIRDAVVFVAKDKDTQSVYLSDKGVRITLTGGEVVIETGFHKHVFNSFTMEGYSRPYLYSKRFLEIVFGNDCTEDGGYSFQKLLNVLGKKEDKTEYNISVYYGWWLSIIYDGLYSISEDEFSSWLVYFKYLQILAVNGILLDGVKEDLTNKQFVEKFKNLIDELCIENEERVILRKKSDEEIVKENIDAMREEELDGGK